MRSYKLYQNVQVLLRRNDEYEEMRPNISSKFINRSNNGVLYVIIIQLIHVYLRCIVILLSTFFILFKKIYIFINVTLFKKNYYYARLIIHLRSKTVIVNIKPFDASSWFIYVIYFLFIYFVDNLKVHTSCATGCMNPLHSNIILWIVTYSWQWSEIKYLCISNYKV